MTKLKKGISMLMAICLTAVLVYCPAASAAPVDLTAFPGAEGGGMYSTGARGDGSSAPELYRVTKLTDDGSYGTLRDAVSESNRVIVFDVAGNIELTRALTIYSDNLTILGQTAPGDGICIKDYNTYMTGDNIIMRYLRFRMGTEGHAAEDSLGGRGINNVIIDHCSISWSADECASFYQNTNFTMQWCIISESLKNSIHPKGSHGYGAIWGGENASYHHNLLANHDSRNPRIDGSKLTEFDENTANMTDLRNNVIYNWGGNTAYGGESGMPVNIVNCYYKPGAASSSSSRDRIYLISTRDEAGAAEYGGKAGWGTDLYVSGNYMEGSSSVTQDNTKGVDKDSGVEDCGIWTDSNITDAEKTIHFRYLEDYPVKTESAQDAYNSVLESAGASIVRDSVDERIVNDVRSGSYSCGNRGLVDTVEQAGGYPTLSGTTAKDSDYDGMPDEWEDKMELDNQDPSDAIKLADSGYLNVEEYANALANGSFERDYAYDNGVQNLPEPTEPPRDEATPSPAPETEVVYEWTASSADKDKAAGRELFPGLTTMFATTGDKGFPEDNITYSDGSRYTAGISSNDNGSWNNETGTSSGGTTLKYTAEENGIFTLYTYLLANKTFYVTREGTTDYQNDYLFKVDSVESNFPVICKVPVTKGETYYFYAAGSKARFQAASFAKYSSVFDILSVTNVGESYECLISKNYDYGDCTAILAAYGSDGNLVTVTTQNMPADIAVGEQRVITMPCDASADMINSVKVFIWSDENNITPLGKFKTTEN